MENYIRTKDGKIIDTALRQCKVKQMQGGTCKWQMLNGCNECRFNEIKDIIKQADTIEGLIEVGDLVVDTKEHYASIVNNLQYATKELDCDELYIKQGDNYILVARKENGDWRVI